MQLSASHLYRPQQRNKQSRLEPLQAKTQLSPAYAAK